MFSLIIRILRPIRWLPFLLPVFIILVLATSCFALLAFAKDDIKTVLILHGVWAQDNWEGDFDAALKRSFAMQQNVAVVTRTEYLGLESSRDDSSRSQMVLHLKNKLGQHEVDLIVGVLPAASNFLHQFGDEFAVDIPRIYVVPGSGLAKMAEEKPDVAYIRSASTAALKNTITQVYEILPETKHLYLVAGIALNDTAYLDRAKQAVIELGKDAQTTDLVGLPLDKLMDTLAQLPPDSAILFVSYEEDSNGDKYIVDKFMTSLSAKANAPIFGFWDTLIGHGVLGGSMTSAEAYASETASAAMRILTGTAPSEIRVKDSSTTNLYDWRQMQRWGIPRSRLPQDHKVFFKAPSLWDDYKNHVIAATALIIFLSIMALVLTLSLRSRKKAWQKAKTSEERLDRALAVNHDGIYEWDTRTNNIYFDARYYTMAGYEPNEFPGRFDEWVARVHPEDYARIGPLVEGYLAGELLTYDVEFRFRGKNSEWMWIRSRLKTFERDEDGKPRRIIGTHTDITSQKHYELMLLSQVKIAEFADKHSALEVLQKVLDEVELLTNSKVGFYHFVADDQEHLSLQNWSTNTLDKM
ncbi:MAG: hypothetical protein C0616_08910, partial [Desulfuromonas sp.]